MKSLPKTQFVLSDLVAGLDVDIRGNAHCLINGICSIQEAKQGQITFLTNSHYRKYLSSTKASAVILSEADVIDCDATLIISKNPHYTYAKIAGYFAHHPDFESGIHSTAVIGPNCEIDATAVIGPNCVIGKEVKIAANVVLGAGTVVGDYSEIGEECKLDARVTLYDKVKLGKRTCIASGAVLGSDGFGFANQKGVWHKVPQLGGVIIGDDVDIGANTTIDRGAVENTVIDNGVKLDNLIQIAHNVKIGEHTIIAGCVAIAGSTVIGKNCMIGGATCFAGHLTICDNAMFTGMTAVTKSITKPGIYSSGIVGAVPNHEFRKNNARFHRLENLIERVKVLESKRQDTER